MKMKRILLFSILLFFFGCAGSYHYSYCHRYMESNYACKNCHPNKRFCCYQKLKEHKVYFHHLKNGG